MWFQEFIEGRSKTTLKMSKDIWYFLLPITGKQARGEGGHCPAPPRSQAKFQMITVRLSNISSYGVVLVKVLLLIYLTCPRSGKSKILIYFSGVGSSLRWGPGKVICSEVQKIPLHISRRSRPVKFFHNNFTLYLLWFLNLYLLVGYGYFCHFSVDLQLHGNVSVGFLDVFFYKI